MQICVIKYFFFHFRISFESLAQIMVFQVSHELKRLSSYFL